MRTIIFMSALVVVCFFSKAVFANSCHSEHASGGNAAASSEATTQEVVQVNAPAADRQEPVKVNNKVCPVMGETIDETSKTLYEYDGKVYSFCCPGCVDEFKANPKKYIEKMNAQEKNAPPPPSTSVELDAFGK